ncbi:MAG: potassium channel protein [Bacteriovoracaceae bacterium]|nr:potassium channel protein [Bacteriovoracaceae bacterium]
MGPKGILKLSFSFLLLLLFGSYTYHYLEGWGLLDSLYMTFITLSTVGYGEVHELSDSGRIFTMFLILGGVGHMAYFMAVIFHLIIDMRFNTFFRRDKMSKSIEKLKGHTIICGYGQMGKLISEEMIKNHHPFVIIDSNSELEEELKKAGVYYVIGNGSDDSILETAGIDRAASLVTTVTNDSENVFITLTAKTLNKDIRIISRVFDDSTIPKLKKAGAFKIISPYAQASQKMAQSIINPAVDDFLEVISNEGRTEYRIADIIVKDKMQCAGKALKDIKLKEQGVIIVGIRRENGERIFAPHKDVTIELGDQLIAMGSGANFTELISSMTQEN